MELVRTSARSVFWTRSEASATVGEPAAKHRSSSSVWVFDTIAHFALRVLQLPSVVPLTFGRVFSIGFPSAIWAPICATFSVRACSLFCVYRDFGSALRRAEIWPAG